MEKPKVLRTGELEKCFGYMCQTGGIPNGTQRVSTDKTPMCGSSTAINSQGKASLARAPDSEVIVPVALT